jgi:hypothetical protein
MRLSISGPGGCGKDSIAAVFQRYLSLRYTHSTSYLVAAPMYLELTKIPEALQHFYMMYLCRADESMLGRKYTLSNFLERWPTEESWYNDRASNRLYWGDWVDRYNKHDHARLYRECLETQDILTGIRKRHEFLSARRLFDLAIWVEQPGIGIDPTQQYGAELCDVIILNEKGLFAETTDRVRNLCRLINGGRIEKASRT